LPEVQYEDTVSIPISNRFSSLSGSSSSAVTRLMIRPTVSQSTRTIRLIVVLSVRVASHATSCSKSRVNPLAWRANGTLSTRTPCTGQDTRRS
jgi:hypothetical protein